MKAKQCILVGFIGICIMMSGTCGHTGAAAGLPDGFEVLKEKMEQKEIPDVDFARLKFNIPDNLPEEINSIKGYLWSGKNAHPAFYGGVVAHLFLLSYNRETGEMVFFTAWESGLKTKPGWNILTGKANAEDKRRIELKSRTGSGVYILLIKNKDLLILRAYDGYEADMKKIGMITPPASAGVTLPGVTLPFDLRIVQPAAGVPKELGVFSGKWAGVWDGTLDHILVVEEINPPHAVAVYAYGAAREWGIDRPGWSRVRGEFIDSTTLKLSLPRPATVIYRMLQDGTLDATYEYARGTSRAKMTRMK